MTSSAVLAIDQGTTNSKAALTRSNGRTLAVGAAPIGVSAPPLGWIEQDAEPDRRRRRQWAGEIGRTRYQDGTR